MDRLCRVYVEGIFPYSRLRTSKISFCGMQGCRVLRYGVQRVWGAAFRVQSLGFGV